MFFILIRDLSDTTTWYSYVFLCRVIGIPKLIRSEGIENEATMGTEALDAVIKEAVDLVSYCFFWSP